MGAHILVEVDGEQYADVLNRFNGMDETFPALQPRHFENGYWWLVYLDEKAVAFAGLVPMEPFDGVGYCKRAFVLPESRGCSLQLRLLVARRDKAKALGWTKLVSECGPNNRASATSFLRAGFSLCDPEQKWAKPDDLYFQMALS